MLRRYALTPKTRFLRLAQCKETISGNLFVAEKPCGASKVVFSGQKLGGFHRDRPSVREGARSTLACADLGHDVANQGFPLARGSVESGSFGSLNQGERVRLVVELSW